MSVRYVFIHLPGQREAVAAGRLELVESTEGELRTSRFNYGRQYLDRTQALEIDPVSLRFAGEGQQPREPLGGLPLFGAIRDAAPDAWGRRVIESRLGRPGPLSESVYLDHAGSNRAGAIDIRSERDSPPRSSNLPACVDLPYLLQAVERIEDGEKVPKQLEHFFEGGPTMGGMRPKAVLAVEGREFIAKFPTRGDRFNVPMVERATLELARRAGLTVPETRIERLDEGREIMLIERFDRQPVAGGLSRNHMVSALTMLGVDEMDSMNKSYADIAEVISARAPAERVQQDRTELFRRMVFNILVTNNDDHLRNHAFLFDAVGRGWGLSPLYDVVPSTESGTDRYLALGVGPNGRLARLDNALAGAGQFGLQRGKAHEIVEGVVAVVREWRNLFDELGVSDRDSERIKPAFRRAADLGFRG